MGILDFLSFKARWEPEPGIEPVSPQELYARLMGLNDQSVPWYIGDGRAEDADLMARWKFEDPYWEPIFRGTSVEDSFMTRMRFDVEKHEVRTRDQMWALQMTHDEKGFIDGEAWTKVTGQLNVTWSGKVNGQTSKLTTDDLKDPLKQAVTRSGWTYRGLAFAKL